MKPRCSNQRTCGLTLTEVLVVIVVLAVLVAMILPALKPAKTRGGPTCYNNLKQIGLAFQVWAGDNGDKFPMEVSVTDGGTMELFNGGSQFKELSFLNYLVMSNELSTPKVLHCPADSDHMAATNFGVNFNNSSISYFLGLAASPKNSQAFLSGDDNFAIGDRPVKPSVLPLATNAPVTWTATRHINRGNIGLADGSVWQTDDEELVQKLVAIGVATNRLAIP